MFGKFFKHLIEGHPDWQEEQERKKKLRELDKEYPSSSFNYDPDPEDGYDWGAHRRGEYDRYRREITGDDSSPYGDDYEYDP